MREGSRSSTRVHWLSARVVSSARKTPASTWRAYLRWRLLADAAGVRALPRALSDEAFWFKARNFTGEKAQPERWKSCVDLVDGSMGHALGHAFVRRHFGGDAKQKALSLVTGVQRAMAGRIASLEWMDQPTKVKAGEKLGTVDNKIAYPNTWQSYDGLVIRRDAYYASASAAGAFELRRQLAKIGQPALLDGRLVHAAGVEVGHLLAVAVVLAHLAGRGGVEQGAQLGLVLLAHHVEGPDPARLVGRDLGLLDPAAAGVLVEVGAGTGNPGGEVSAQPTAP